MKSFDIPDFYKSSLIGELKNIRRKNDKLKKDFEPTVLDFGPVKILMARHFGFCYGVENAIEIAYKAIEQNEGKNIFLLSEMIHNPDVNQDLQNRGVKFIMDTNGKELLDWKTIEKEDIVIVPAFGTTIEIQAKLMERGVNPYEYDTTCPFVEKVWKRASQLGEQDYTVVIHGKPSHEETRATFSHSQHDGHTIVIENMAEAIVLADFITGKKPIVEFKAIFGERCSKGFDAAIHLKRLGVVNQTTMLASDTQGIADYLKKVVVQFYDLSKEKTNLHFADTRDTLCYATNDNQNATAALIEHKADFAIVAGGYNSSNTTHLVELCEQKLPTFFIESAKDILSNSEISHFDIHSKKVVNTKDFMPKAENLNIILTCGASCPDSVVELILNKLISFFPGSISKEAVLEKLVAVS